MTKIQASPLMLGLITTLLAMSSANARTWPDKALTPGARNLAVTQANIKSTICKPGWTATIRPPASYTNALKVQQIIQYQYVNKNPANYEEDHLISLELGGDPRDPKNLWPQAYTKTGSCGARTKDAIETRLKYLVCANKLPLAKAQMMIANDWVKAYTVYVRPLKCPSP